MTRYAIILGVENYENFPPTPFAHADGDLLQLTLTQKCDYATQHTLHLNLTPQKQQTPAEILEKIQKTVNGSREGDTIIFYFAGHGHFANGKAYLILPGTISSEYETTAISLDDISKELKKPQRACFRIFDACHSGLDVREGKPVIDSESFIRDVTHDATGWVTLAACREDQFAVSDPQIGQGVFTHYLCRYISELKSDELIYPELLKLEITEKVSKHANRLGYTQTPTFNGSISGNISLARRCEGVLKKESSLDAGADKGDLFTRVARIRKIPDMFKKEWLEKSLNCFVNSYKKEFEKAKLFDLSILVGNQISADEIPEYMHREIVNFVRQQGLSPRHYISRNEEYEESPGYLMMDLPKFLKKVKQVTYHVSQPNNQPNSVCLVTLQGDELSVPTIKVLLYVIPLQLSICLLAASYKQNWPPYNDFDELLCQSFKIFKPDMELEEAVGSLGAFAVKKTTEKIEQITKNRVEQLERELSK
jgi:hypothetical protein